MNNVKKHFSEGDIFLNQLVFKNFKDLFKKKTKLYVASITPTLLCYYYEYLQFLYEIFRNGRRLNFKNLHERISGHHLAIRSLLLLTGCLFNFPVHKNFTKTNTNRQNPAQILALNELNLLKCTTGV